MHAGNRRREDSGLIDLDALMRQTDSSPSVDESGARPVAMENERTRSEPTPKHASPPPASTFDSASALVTPIPIAARVPEVIAIETETPSAKETTKASRRAKGLLAIGLLVALSGFGFLAYRRASAPPSVTPVAVVTPREPAAAAPRALEGTHEEAPAQPNAPAANDLPTVAAIAPSSTASAVTPSVTKHAAAPAKSADAVVTTTELIPESPSQAGDLGRAMHDAVGESSPRVAKVEATQGNDARTLRPSPGAVIGALNAVLPSARECLGPDDAVRVGTVTFRSDGTVAKVELNGKRDTDECVRSAVSRARIEPFADESFATRVTVWP